MKMRFDVAATRQVATILPKTSHRRFPKRRYVEVATFALCLLSCAFCLPAFSQNITLDWFTIDGGGGTSTGAGYSVNGTIGQPFAGGPLTNGQYSVTGGFWALPTTMHVIGTPTLTIVSAGAEQAAFSWTPNTPGFVLQETSSLSPTNWINSPSIATNPIVVSVASPTKFY